MTDRQSAIRGLAEDLDIARYSAQMVFHLREMIHHKANLVRLADDLVWLTLRAMRDSAVIHAWKVLDSQRSAHSLRWFIKTWSSCSPDVKRDDLERLSSKHADVHRLQELRHELVAHRGHRAAASGADKWLVTNNLSEDEFAGLLDDCRAILRRHARASLPSPIASRVRDAVPQLIELDVHFLDAVRGFGGIEHWEPEIDGSVRRSAG